MSLTIRGIPSWHFRSLASLKLFKTLNMFIREPRKFTFNYSTRSFDRLC